MRKSQWRQFQWFPLMQTARSDVFDFATQNSEDVLLDGIKMKKVLIFIILLISILFPILSFEILNKSQLTRFNSFYAFCGLGLFYILMLVISIVLILKSKYSSLLKIFYSLIAGIYVLMTFYIMNITVP